LSHKQSRKNLFQTKKDIVSLDPGVRTFQTGYCSNEMLELGKNCSTVLKEKLLLLDKIDRRRKTEPLAKGRLDKKYDQIQRKITNLVDELHFKTINHLYKNYHTIVIGKMSTQSIVKGKMISKMTKRILLAMRHYEFRNRLKAKCVEYKIQFYEVDESYTTMTCSVCGKINRKVGASEIFRCIRPTCGIEMKRDFNGGRGIFLKNRRKYKKICLF
jgi:putative transposase